MLPLHALPGKEVIFSGRDVGYVVGLGAGALISLMAGVITITAREALPQVLVMLLVIDVREAAIALATELTWRLSIGARHLLRLGEQEVPLRLFVGLARCL